MSRPSPADFDELLSFLPRLYPSGWPFRPILRWAGGGSEAIHLPHPVYDPLVLSFIDSLRRECWMDPSYDVASAGGMLRDAQRVAGASLDEVRSMATFVVRGERFSDGHWGAVIEGGDVKRLLERVAALRGSWGSSEGGAVMQSSPKAI